jgi:two-component sensor histidine kinase
MDVRVADITITPELWTRAAHQPDIQAEVAAIRQLADAMSTRPADLFQLCAELALRLCRADACGISLCGREKGGDEVFRCIALAGAVDDDFPRETPRAFSPCGVCIDSGEPVLMSEPERVFSYLRGSKPCHDLLLIPLSEPESHLVGTIWLIAQDPQRKFDAEDCRIMQRIAVFTSTALHAAHVITEARHDAEMQRTRFSELDHRIRNTLQMVSAVLRNQLMSVADPLARAAIETARDRMLALGQLHQAGAGAVSDLRRIVDSICKDLTAGTGIRCHLRTEPIEIPSHKAAVVALIVNELVTNAIKHAFRGRHSGDITIDLTREGSNVRLAVADDGAPLPAPGAGRPNGMGLRLLQRLVAHLGGTLQFEPEGKRFIAVFPADEAR